MLVEFKKDQGIDLAKDQQALQRLKEAAEKAKIELSSTTTEINLPYITADATGPKHLVVTLNRAKLEDLVADLVNQTAGPVKAALKDAGLKPDDIDEVILVGGMTALAEILQRVSTVAYQASASARAPVPPRGRPVPMARTGRMERSVVRRPHRRTRKPSRASSRRSDPGERPAGRLDSAGDQ